MWQFLRLSKGAPIHYHEKKKKVSLQNGPNISTIGDQTLHGWVDNASNQITQNLIIDHYFTFDSALCTLAHTTCFAATMFLLSNELCFFPPS